MLLKCIHNIQFFKTDVFIYLLIYKHLRKQYKYFNTRWNQNVRKYTTNHYFNNLI